MDRETLKQACRTAVAERKCGKYVCTSLKSGCTCWCDEYAEAVLSAIAEAGCVVVPEEATVEMREAGALKLDADPIRGDYMIVDSVYRAMLSASPFRQEE